MLPHLINYLFSFGHFQTCHHGSQPPASGSGPGSLPGLPHPALPGAIPMLTPGSKLQVCVTGLAISQTKAILAVALAAGPPALAALCGFSWSWALAYKDKKAIQNFGLNMSMAEEQR